MIWLVTGVLLWMAAHLFKRVLPEQRAALGRMGRPLVALAILVSIGLMVIGYRASEPAYLYALPAWVWYLNNALMLVAVFLMDVGRVNGVVRTRIRHPMLSGGVVWSAAHLLVNGDLRSLLLFGGLGAWALVEMVVINRAEGAWQPPARGSLSGDGKAVILAAAIYAAIAGIHYWLGYPVIAFL
jgi:uncharacterized membrane protein